MKKHIYIYLLALCALIGCKDNSGLYGLLTDYDVRISKLEQLCAEMNTNITSLTTIVEAQQSGDYITAITPIIVDGKEVGYTITFAKHDPISIYSGEKGDQGTAPIVGVKQDTDGEYYWTLDGEWIVDGEGHKIKVTGNDGAQGATPQLKIEADYWWISYDNGATWTQLDQAKGDKGEDGDSMFQSVTQDETHVYFTLADGTVITINKGEAGSVPIVDGAIMAEFSVSATKKVYFSQGNLVYSSEGTHLCADGTTKPGTWRFAEHQWETGTYFYFGNSGYEYEVEPSDTSIVLNYHMYQFYKDHKNNISGTYYNWDISGTYYDYGIFNAVINGGDNPGEYRLLSREEWDYLLNQRPNADLLKGTIKVDDIKGTYILPDTWAYLGAEMPGTVYTNTNQLFEQYIPFKTLQDIGMIFFASGKYASTYMYSQTNSYGTRYYVSYVMSDNEIVEAVVGRDPGTYSVSGIDGRINIPLVRLVKDVK